jgi:flagellar basal body-associated protein FliL
MDSASILVLVLCVGVFALLVWFEMNSRANEARKKQSSSAAQPDMNAFGKQATNTAESEAAKKKAA